VFLVREFFPLSERFELDPQREDSLIALLKCNLGEEKGLGKGISTLLDGLATLFCQVL